MESTRSREIFLRWLLAVGGFAGLIFFFSPPWAAFRIWARVPELGAMIELRRGASVLWQIEHPGGEIPDKLHGAIQWRLLFPLIGRGLNLPVPVFFALAPLGCMAALAFIVTVLRRRGAGFFESGLAAVALGAASWFFASTSWLGYFDGWLVLGLLLVAFGQTRWAVWAACGWAPWVDERFVLAAPLAMLCRRLLHDGEKRAGEAGSAWRQELGVAAGLIGAFVVVRLGILSGSSGKNATVGGYLDGLNVVSAPWSRILFGLWEGLRVGWFFVAAAVGLGWRRGMRGMALGAVTLAVVAVGVATAQDFSRSMMLVVPVALLGVVWARETAARWLPGALRAGAVAAVVLPAHLVMNDHVSPIFYLYHELAALDSPPASIMPEVHELKGVDAMERGEFAEAHRELSLAIKLAANPASASKHRGLLAAGVGKWDEARRDFSTMVEREPQNPDGWFLRAQATMALGDVAGARADFQQAQSVAIGDWAKRPDVLRFMQTLNRAGGGK